MKNFVIAGLPRSGTAWCAALLSTIPGVHCWHEASQHGDHFFDYRDAMAVSGPEIKGGDYEFIGDSTTDTRPEIAIEGAHVWIFRPLEQSKAEYFLKMGGSGRAAWDQIEQNAEDWMKRNNPEVIRFHRLFSEDGQDAFKEAERLVKACTGKPLAFERWLMLKKLQVQIYNLHPEYYSGKRILTISKEEAT